MNKKLIIVAVIIILGITILLLLNQGVIITNGLVQNQTQMSQELKDCLSSANQTYQSLLSDIAEETDECIGVAEAIKDIKPERYTTLIESCNELDSIKKQNAMSNYTTMTQECYESLNE
jgi:hypothetical protein